MQHGTFLNDEYTACVANAANPNDCGWIYGARNLRNNTAMADYQTQALRAGNSTGFNQHSTFLNDEYNACVANAANPADCGWIYGARNLRNNTAMYDYQNQALRAGNGTGFNQHNAFLDDEYTACLANAANPDDCGGIYGARNLRNNTAMYDQYNQALRAGNGTGFNQHAGLLYNEYTTCLANAANPNDCGWIYGARNLRNNTAMYDYQNKDYSICVNSTKSSGLQSVCNYFLEK
jgi:hypothetical protein